MAGERREKEVEAIFAFFFSFAIPKLYNDRKLGWICRWERQWNDFPLFLHFVHFLKALGLASDAAAISNASEAEGKKVRAPVMAQHWPLTWGRE